MPGTHVLLAALLLCAAGTARAAISGADAKAFCSYVNDGALAGGWQTAEAVPAEVEEAVLKAFLASDAVNATTLRSILECMDEPLISSEGCSQVVAGAKWEVRVNITCDGETVGLQTAVFIPLGSSNELPKVEPLEVLFWDSPEAEAGVGDATFKLYKDIDFYGGEIEDQVNDFWSCGGDALECQAQCANRTDCETFSWVPLHPRCSGPTCYLKGEASLVTCERPAEGVVAGRREPLGDKAPLCSVERPTLLDGCIFTIEADKGLEGGKKLETAGAQELKTQTTLECCQACTKTDGKCKGFTFTEATGACVLAADFDYSLKSATGVLAGVA